MTLEKTRLRGIDAQSYPKSYFSSPFGAIFPERESEGIIIRKELSEATVIGNKGCYDANTAANLSDVVIPLEVSYSRIAKD